MQTEMQEIGRQLAADDRCPLCGNAGLIDCPTDLHMAETDADGWCTTCDSPDRSRVACYCQDA